MDQSGPPESTGGNIYWTILKIVGLFMACVFLDLIWLILQDTNEEFNAPITSFIFFYLPIYLYELLGWWLFLILFCLATTLVVYKD